MRQQIHPNRVYTLEIARIPQNEYFSLAHGRGKNICFLCYSRLLQVHTGPEDDLHHRATILG
jgi:hypothetical protein